MCNPVAIIDFTQRPEETALQLQTQGSLHPCCPSRAPRSSPSPTEDTGANKNRGEGSEKKNAHRPSSIFPVSVSSQISGPTLPKGTAPGTPHLQRWDSGPLKPGPPWLPSTCGLVGALPLGLREQSSPWQSPQRGEVWQPPPLLSQGTHAQLLHPVPRGASSSARWCGDRAGGGIWSSLGNSLGGPVSPLPRPTGLLSHL